MPQAIVGKNAQITLPSETVEYLQIGEGDTLNIKVVDGKILMEIEEDEEWPDTPEMLASLRQSRKDKADGRTGIISKGKSLEETEANIKKAFIKSLQP